jgi:hypothetical protein
MINKNSRRITKWAKRMSMQFLNNEIQIANKFTKMLTHISNQNCNIKNECFAL